MKLSKGFTLIELIVVMAVFIFVITASISIFLSIIQSQRKVLVKQQVFNQISYIEEYVSKALRMAKTDLDGGCLGEANKGYVYLLTGPDAVSGLYTGIKFINQTDNNACQEFFLDYTNPDQPILKERKNGSNAVALSSNNLHINYISFGINETDGSIASSPKPNDIFAGASNIERIQPRVTMLMSFAISGDDSILNCPNGIECGVGQTCLLKKCVPTKTIQTTISRRNLNIK
jgi:type II secretory pathway pseudopilin PulG